MYAITFYKSLIRWNNYFVAEPTFNAGCCGNDHPRQMLHYSHCQDTPLAQDFAESYDGFRPSRDQIRPVWEGVCAHGDLHLDDCDPPPGVVTGPL